MRAALCPERGGDIAVDCGNRPDALASWLQRCLAMIMPLDEGRAPRGDARARRYCRRATGRRRPTNGGDRETGQRDIRPASGGSGTRRHLGRSRVLVNDCEAGPVSSIFPRADRRVEPRRADYVSLRSMLRSPPRWNVWPDGPPLRKPNLVAIAADRLGRRCAPLVCTDRHAQVRPSGACLSQLAGAGAELRYHGDFDWPGLHIGNLVMPRIRGTALAIRALRTTSPPNRVGPARRPIARRATCRSDMGHGIDRCHAATSNCDRRRSRGG